MSWLPTRRHLMAMGGVAATSALLPPITRAQGTAVESLKIGAIFPSRSGLSRVLTSLTDYTGDGGRRGALVAEQQIGDIADAQGTFLKVYQASSPTPASAVRAAERLIELEQPHALLGGVGDGQLEAILPIAEQAGIPVFNIGTPDDRFRNRECSRLLFHMEGSDAMYLDAMVQWSAGQGHRRWFIVYEDNIRGMDMHARAVRAIAKFGEGGEAVGGAATIFEQPVYFNELEQARRAGADSILVLLNSIDIIAFLGQHDQIRSDMAIVAYPDAVVQTRDYLLATRQVATEYTPPHRIQLWETTLTENGAGAFNERYMGRFSDAADPTAWSSYSAVKVLYETVAAIGTTDPAAIIAHLESGVEFDLFKGPGTSFRPWDHQLRQPMYLVGVDFSVAVNILQLDTRIATGFYEETLPPGGPTDNPVAWLDQYGDLAADSACSF